MSTELDQELERIHLQIAELLGLERQNLNFEYASENEKAILKLITINPRHKQSFLFHSTQGFGKLDALKKMLGFVRDQRQIKNTYTIQWSLKDDIELHTSYFRGNNIYDVLDKFYYGKDVTGTIIFSISLNPIA